MYYLTKGLNNSIKFRFPYRTYCKPNTVCRNCYQYLDARTLDFINLMCYDYHGYAPYDPVTGYNSPLYPTDWDKQIVLTEGNVVCRFTYREIDITLIFVFLYNFLTP